MVSLTKMDVYEISISSIQDSITLDIEKVAEIDLITLDFSEIEARVAAFFFQQAEELLTSVLGLPAPDEGCKDCQLYYGDLSVPFTPTPPPVCFQCEDNCDECSFLTPKEFNECSATGLCSDCEYESECWEGRRAAEMVEPAKPACFNCKDRCCGCTKVDNPLYCLQCKICDLKADCSVYRGYFQTYGEV